MQDDQWWGYSKQHGWVVLDRSKLQNKPGERMKLLFIRCRDWSEFEEERKNWHPPEYLYAPNYINQLSHGDAIEASLYFQKLIHVWLKKKSQFELKEQEQERFKEDEIRRQHEREITKEFSKYGISCLWHMTHKDNISSILKYGVVNHYYASKLNVNRVDISDPDVQRWRENIEPHYNRRIHDYAPLYINPRNPMLYVRKHLQEDLCLVEISFSVLSKSQYLFTDGNASSRNTRFYSSINKLELLPWDVLHADFWNVFPDGKRQKCAEVLVYPAIPPKFLSGIHCFSKNTLDFLSSSNIDVSLTKKLFF